MSTMPRTEREKSHTLQFPNSWRFIRYDTCDWFINKVNPCQDLKAVDFLLEGPERVYWIEFKDYLQSPAELEVRFSVDVAQLPDYTNVRRLLEGYPSGRHYALTRRHESLDEEVAYKWRDTAVGLLGAQLNGETELIPFIPNHKSKLTLVLVLETAVAPREQKRRLGRFKDRLKKRIGFLSQDVRVVNSQSSVGADEGWSVTYDEVSSPSAPPAS